MIILRYSNIKIKIGVKIPEVGKEYIRFTPEASENAVTLGLQYRFAAS